METKDYMQRQIDQIGMMLGLLIRKLMGLNGGDIPTLGLSTINETLQNELDIDLNALLEKEPHEMIDFLINEKHFSAEALDNLCSILFTLAEHHTSDTNKRNKFWSACACLDKEVESQLQAFSFQHMIRKEKILTAKKEGWY